MGNVCEGLYFTDEFYRDSNPYDYCIMNEHFRILRFALLTDFQYFAILVFYLTFHTDNYLNDGKK